MLQLINQDELNMEILQSLVSFQTEVNVATSK